CEPAQAADRLHHPHPVFPEDGQDRHREQEAEEEQGGLNMARVFEGMYIGGGWSAATRTFKDLNPADGSVWAEVPDSGRAETTAAIEAAQAAFPEWSQLPFSKRAHYLTKAADI